MKRFILKLLCFFLMTTILFGLLTFIGFKVIPPQFTTQYTAAYIDKIDRLKNINEPKILLVGNSNLSFGINSEMIEKEFNMPVVNLGLHGGLGNEFHENMAKINISEGDRVIICHDSYITDKNIDYSLMWTTLDGTAELLETFCTSQKWSMLKAMPNYLTKKFHYFIHHKKNNGMYARESFNKWGDNIYPRKTCRYQFKEKSVNVPKIDNETILRLNELNKYCIQKGATLVIAGYPIAYGKYTPAKSEYIAFQETLEKSVDCAVISDFTDYFIEYQHFYDTPLHLTDEGVIIRTTQLIKDMKQYWG